MALQTQQLERTFRYNSVDLIDPGAQYTPEQVRDFYAPTYPEILNAAIEGPDEKEGKLRYTFRRAVGTKGVEKPLKLQVKSGGAWKDVSQFDPSALYPVRDSTTQLARRLSGDEEWRVIEVGGRSPKVLGYCEPPEYGWRAK